MPSLKGKAPLARACHQDCIKQPLHSMQVKMMSRVKNTLRHYHTTVHGAYLISIMKNN